MNEKAVALRTLETLLLDALRLGRSGSARERLARAQGLVDGYQRALLETGLFASAELLTAVREVRESADGPATASVSAETERAA